jgi:hypothetical protein
MDLSKAARMLGRKGGSKPKNYSPEEIEIRKRRLAAAREKRWPKTTCETIKGDREQTKKKILDYMSKHPLIVTPRDDPRVVLLDELEEEGKVRSGVPLADSSGTLDHANILWQLVIT